MNPADDFDAGGIQPDPEYEQRSGLSMLLPLHLQREAEITKARLDHMRSIHERLCELFHREGTIC